MADLGLHLQLQILEAFESANTLTMGPSDVARALGISKGTASPHLRALAQAGYLAELPEAGGRYTLGHRLYQIGHAFLAAKLAEIGARTAEHERFLKTQQAVFATAAGAAVGGRVDQVA